jgi:hypothetical protein
MKVYVLTCDQQLAQQSELRSHHNSTLKLTTTTKTNTTKVKYTILTDHTRAAAEDMDVATASVEEDSAEVATEVATVTREEGTLIEDIVEMVDIREDSTRRSAMSARNQDVGQPNILRRSVRRHMINSAKNSM